MKSFPLPVIFAATSALTSLPFDGTASAMFAITAGLGAILSVDYSRRYRGLAVPRLRRASHHVPSIRSLAVEPNRLAA